jgi:ribosomal-protein-alanine N-acetyltransferase
MEIQTANILDLNALRKLEHACFEKDAWPLLDLIAVLTWSDVIRLKAMETGGMIGFIASDPRRSDGTAWIAIVAVDPHFRRRGIATELIAACEAHVELPTIKLVVRLSNENAISLYEKLGYRNSDIWRAYYSDGEDGLVMAKKLY